MKEYIKKWGKLTLVYPYSVIRDSYLLVSSHLNIISIVLILSLMLYLNFIVFPTPILYTNDLNRTIISNQTYLDIPSYIEEISRPSKDLNPSNLPDALYKMIYASAKNDRICFENTGSAIYYNTINGTRKSYDIVPTVDYSGETFNVTNKVVCKYISRDQDKFTFQWHFIGHLTFRANETTAIKVPINETHYRIQRASGEISPSFNTYIKLGTRVTDVLKLTFFFFSSGALLWAWGRTFVLLKKKKNKSKE